MHYWMLYQQELELIQMGGRDPLASMVAQHQILNYSDYLLYPIIFSIVGYGLWKMKRWAYWLQILLAIVVLCCSLVFVGILNVDNVFTFFKFWVLLPPDLGIVFITFLPVNLISSIYLYTTRQYFGIGKQEKVESES